MSVTVLARAEARESSTRSAGRLFDPGGRPTLDDLVTSAWEGDRASADAHCLVCGERWQASGAAREGASRACPSCGSRLE
jgi:hypothetical protein